MTCDAYCVVSLPEPVRRPPPRAALPHAAWESGHLGRVRASSPHSWPLSQTGTAQGSEGPPSNVICITRLGREKGNVSTSTCSVEGHFPLCAASAAGWVRRTAHARATHSGLRPPLQGGDRKTLLLGRVIQDSALAGEESGEGQGGAVGFDGGWNDASSNGSNLRQDLLGKEAQALRREFIR